MDSDDNSPAKTVLVVDDEPIVRDLESELLKRQGLEVIACESGEEALAIFLRKWSQIDLVILDLVMPDMNGAELFHAMKQIHPDIRVVLSSGYSGAVEAQQLLDAGALAFVQKPFRQAQFRRVVTDALQTEPS